MNKRLYRHQVSDGIRVVCRQHDPGAKTLRHAHAHPSLIFVAAGEGVCLGDTGPIELEPDTAVILGAHVGHQLHDTPGKPMLIFVVYFARALVEPWGQTLEGKPDRPVAVHVAPHTAREIRRLLRRMLHEQNTRPADYQTALQVFLATALLEIRREQLRQGRLDRQQTNSLERVRQVLAHVTSHYFEPHSLEQTARMARLSPRRFSTLCRQVTGCSFAQYVSSLRVNQAQQRLQDSDLPVAAVAFEVGFEDVSTFYRAFKRCSGMTPTQFRRRQSPA